MRLGQLARKLARRPSEIVEFLSVHSIAVDDNSNTKLEDDHVILIMKEFAPANTVDAPAVPKNGLGEEMPLTPEATEDQGEQIQEVPEPREYSPPSSESEELKPEVIKAPKVELSGLKVIGKIDLPEPRKKEPPAAISEVPEENPKNAETLPPEAGKPKVYKKERTEQRPARKNPIALQREREAQEAERKKQLKAEQEKEKRTKKYYSKVKGSAPTKRVKLVEEPTTEMSASELREVPRTWVGRFLNWLKT
jgi:hypothetical protein